MWAFVHEETLQIIRSRPPSPTIQLDRLTFARASEGKLPDFHPYTSQKVSGNAAKTGIQNGDTVVYTSSFFGDELWPSDDPNFTKSALNACPSPACIVYVSRDHVVSRATYMCTYTSLGCPIPCSPLSMAENLDG